MKPKKYKRITLEERGKIEVLLLDGKGPSEIARILKRPRSTIFREIKRGKDLPGKWYTAIQAQRHWEIKNRIKRKETKINSNKELYSYVFEKLKTGWSPEQIANRIILDYPKRTDMRISHESIYKHIYKESQGKQQKELIALLPYKKPRRQGGKKRHVYMGKIPGRVSTSERPEAVNKRLEAGHWEGDLVIGKGQSSAIGTLVERKTRYAIIVPLESKRSRHVVNRFAGELQRLPALFLKTLTYDNGIEMSDHKHFTYRTKMPVYFAAPYSSWERGTNENTNGLIRRFFPKKTNFNEVTDQELKEVERKLNNRPRKVLDWKTPLEKLSELCA